MPDDSDIQPFPRRCVPFHVPSWLVVAGAAAVAITIPVRALVTATGVTYLGDSSHDTEFIVLSWSWSWSWLLVLIPGVAARFRVRLARILGFVVVAPQVVATG